MATAATQERSYQLVDGLEEIYVDLGGVPNASFVFETAAKAQAAAEGVKLDVKMANAMGLGNLLSDNSMTDLLEVLRGSNVSGKASERVISYSAKSTGTVGRPTKTTHELLHKLGNAMRNTAYSKTIKAVPIYGVDSDY